MDRASNLVDLLEHVVSRQSVTTRPGVIGTRSGFRSSPPIDLGAMEARDRLSRAVGAEQLDAEAEAWRLVERPSTVPLGLCPCGVPVMCEFDRVAGQCRECGTWISRADAVHAAREYVSSTWLTPAEIEAETRAWGTPVRAGRVRLWRHRGRIVARADGRYRLADVLALLDRQADAA